MFVVGVQSDIFVGIVLEGIVAGLSQELVVEEDLEQRCCKGTAADFVLVGAPGRRH